MEHEVASYRAVEASRESGIAPEANSSGLSWGAVTAGAFVAAASSLILLSLGAGFGLTVVSPWTNVGISLSTLSAAAIGWLLVSEMGASALGGYITGRLRTKWARIHSAEVYFRDTANGLVAWAVAVVMSVAFLATAATAMAGFSMADTGTAAASARGFGASATLESSASDPSAYYVDQLLRPADPGASAADNATRAEVRRILLRGTLSSVFAAPDRDYLVQLVAAKTGLGPEEADRRVTRVLFDARSALDAERKITARALLWSFVALLAGAFSASFSATLGGRQRDQVVVVV